MELSKRRNVARVVKLENLDHFFQSLQILKKT